MQIYLMYLVLNNVMRNQFPYLINPDTIQYDSDGISLSLYAYTCDKDLAKLFLECRNKDIFYMKKKKIHKSEYKNFNSKFYLYELIDNGIPDYWHPLSVTRFESIIATDINQYSCSIHQLIDDRRKNIDVSSIEYLRNNEMLEAVNQVYGTYKTPFEIWVRYFAPTIDIYKLFKHTVRT